MLPDTYWVLARCRQNVASVIRLMIACHKRRDAAPRVHAAQAAEPKPIYRNNGMSGTSLISYWADGALSIGYCQLLSRFFGINMDPYERDRRARARLAATGVRGGNGCIG